MTLLRAPARNTLRGHRLRQRRTLRDVSGAARVSLGYLSEVEQGTEGSLLGAASPPSATPWTSDSPDLLGEMGLELRNPEGAAPGRPVAPAGRRPCSGGRAGRRAAPHRAGLRAPLCARQHSCPLRAAPRQRQSRSRPEGACSPRPVPAASAGVRAPASPARTPAAEGTPWDAPVRAAQQRLPGVRRAGCAAARCSRWLAARRPASPRGRSTTASGPRTTSHHAPRSQAGATDRDGHRARPGLPEALAVLSERARCTPCPAPAWPRPSPRSWRRCSRRRRRAVGAS